MKRKHLIVCIILLFVVSEAALGMECKDAKTKRPMIDLFDLMLLFMIPESADYTALSWATGAQPDSPIEWETSGAGGGQREGEVVVTIDGSPICVLKRYVEPASWRITLRGAHVGVEEIRIWSETSGGCVDLEKELRNRNIPFELVMCPPDPSVVGPDVVYRIKVPDKKPAWLHYSESHGSGGCWGSFTIFLNERDARQVPHLDTDCRKQRESTSER